MVYDVIPAIINASNMPDIRETPGISEAQSILEIADAEAHMHELAVVPKGPHKLLSIDNAVVVTKEIEAAGAA